MDRQQLLRSMTIIRFLVLSVYSQRASEHFTVIHESEYICPGNVITLECTVQSRTTPTVWKGNVLNCETGINNEITLLQRNDSQFLQNVHTCNNGTIMSQGIQIENDSFTSQLNITVELDKIGKQIECLQEASPSKLIGRYVVEFPNIAVCFPGPDALHLHAVDTGLRQITFSWSAVASRFPVIHYNISAMKCGSCPNVTNQTRATCIDVPRVTTCTFIVQTIVNQTIIGGRRNITVTIKNIAIPEMKQIEGIFIAGIVTLLIAFTLIIVFCCGLGLKYKKSKSHSTTRIDHDHRPRSEEGSPIGTLTLHAPNELTGVERHESPEYSELDEITLDLQSLLRKLQGQNSKQWYQLGLLLGIPMDVLEGFNLYSEKDCLVEVLDHWLKNHPDKPTWKEIIDAQRKLENFNDHENNMTLSDKEAQGFQCDDVPPPKPPRRCSSVIRKKSDTNFSIVTKDDNDVHNYEFVK